MYHIDSDIMPVLAHGRDTAPITGSGKLARRYAQPNHGLVVRTTGKPCGAMALAQRSRAAINRAFFELEDRERIYRCTPVDVAIMHDNL